MKKPSGVTDIETKEFEISVKEFYEHLYNSAEYEEIMKVTKESFELLKKISHLSEMFIPMFTSVTYASDSTKDEEGIPYENETEA